MAAAAAASGCGKLGGSQQEKAPLEHGDQRSSGLPGVSGTRRNLRNDLLVAADSITNTMSSLVKELHSAEEEDEEEMEKMQNGKDRG